MIAVGAVEFDLARLLLDLLIVLAAAKVLAEVAERVRVPSVVGEIIAGLLVGPSVLGLVSLEGSRGVSMGVLAEIGVLLLLMQVGMEMDLRELGSVGRSSVLVAVIGVVAPFAGGTGAAIALGLPAGTSVFVGAALTATSVGITARVFGDLRALSTPEARVVLGAAVADDVLGLVILTVVVKVVTGGRVGVDTVAGTLGLAVVFLLASGAVGLLGVPRLLDLIDRRSGSPATVSVAALALTLAFAQFADAANLAFIIGAFMAGLAVGASRHHERVGRDLGSVANVLIPIFFAQIGVNADLGAMFEPSALAIAAVLSIIAVTGKLVAALGVVGTRADRLLVGFGMIPRGEVGLIFASIGLGAGIIDADQYGALLLVVLVTTLATPPLLRWRLGRASATAAPSASTDEPPQGWLTVERGTVVLHGTPPASMLGTLAVRAAALVTDARPGSALLAWFSSTFDQAVVWHQADTPALTRVLRRDDAKAWRLLEATGVLERALPEVAAAMRRRRADLGDLDPLHALRFPVIERLTEHDYQSGPADDLLVLAAFVADVCGDHHDETCSSALARRLVDDAAAIRISALVADAWLLRAGIDSPRRFEQRELLQLATHLASITHARAANVLATALGPLRREQREALDERLSLVVGALDHPGVTGGAAHDLAAARRVSAERLLDERALERIRAALAGRRR